MAGTRQVDTRDNGLVTKAPAPDSSPESNSDPDPAGLNASPHLSPPVVDTGLNVAPTGEIGALPNVKPPEVDPAPAAPTREAELVKQSKVVMRTGLLLLSAGAGAYRVKAAMAKVAHTLGITKHRALVTATEITTTSHSGTTFRTEVGEVRSVGVDSARLAAFERFIRFLPPHETANHVRAELTRIANRPPLYPIWFNAGAAGVACSAFAYLNHGGPIECGGVLISAFCGQFIRRLMARRKFNQFGVVLIASMSACLVYLGILTLLNALGLPGSAHQAGFISAVLFLVPGFALVTGALDLARLDYSAGISRVTNALMVTVFAGLGVWSIASLAGLSAAAPPPAELPFWITLALRAFASYMGVLGFALMFSSPWGMALWAALLGMISNVARLAMLDAGMVMLAGAFAGAMIAGLLTWWVAIHTHYPRTTLAVPAVVIMVPGATAYRAVGAFNTGAPDAMTYAIHAVLAVVGIVVGLALARMLTDREWAYER